MASRQCLVSRVASWIVRYTDPLTTISNVWITNFTLFNVATGLYSFVYDPFTSFLGNNLVISLHLLSFSLRDCIYVSFVLFSGIIWVTPFWILSSHRWIQIDLHSWKISYRKVSSTLKNLWTIEKYICRWNLGLWLSLTNIV